MPSPSLEKLSEYVEKLRKNKDNPNDPAFLLYKITETAHPTVREVLEYQAAQALMAGEIIARRIEEASKTPDGKRQIQEMFARVSQGLKPDEDSLNEESND